MTEDTKPEVKTSEELEAERNERFKNNPNSFIEVSELACAALLTPGKGVGVGILVADMPRVVLNVAQVELNHRIDMVRMQMDMAKASKVVKPSGGIMNFVKRGKK